MIRVLPLRLLVPLLYMGAVFYLSSLSARELQRWGVTTLLANLAHVPLYAGLAWATLWAVVGPLGPRLACVGLGCLAFAVTDEFHQNFVPGRVFSLGDVGADALGIGLGIAVGLWASSRTGKERSSA